MGFDLDDNEDDVLASKDPQVTSQDPEERKAARALRIKRRQDALKRAEQPQEEIRLEESPSLIEQATNRAAEELQRLALDGSAMVTNVKVTTDEREVIRRHLFSTNLKASLAKLEAEAEESQIQYEAISGNWDAMLELNDPLDIDASMKEQKLKCDELLEQKNRLVDELKEDLRKMDKAYYQDLATQDRDIKELSDRIEKQITIMQRAYERQLFLIEEAINIERETMIDHNNKRWEALYKQRDKEEIAHMDYKYEQIEDNKQKMEAIMWDHHEKYRAAKIELESLIQELQKELEKLKAVCIINSEKIGYNYQVLKKREEENVFVRSQQKRKLNKMSDVANGLRAKIRKAAEDGAAEEIRADAEITKLMEMMDDLEKKSKHFSHVNDYKFHQVWRMSAAQCLDLVKELREAEVAVHAHVLAEPPPPLLYAIPKSPLVEHTGGHKEESLVAVDNSNTDVSVAKERLVRHILQLVSDNTGFLVEDRLIKLIEKYQQGPKNLCTLDAIFMALEIEAEEDIDLLCEHFLQYAFCPICACLDNCSEDISHLMCQDSNQSPERKSMVERRAFDVGKVRSSARSIRSISVSTSRSVGFRAHDNVSPTDLMLMKEADEIIQKYGGTYASSATPAVLSDINISMSTRRGPRGVVVTSQSCIQPERMNNPFQCPAGHDLEIEPVQVLQALGEFTSIFVSTEKEKLDAVLDSVKPPDFSTSSRRLKPEAIEQYWGDWKKIFPPEKDRFWDGILTGLNNYLNILQEREKLHDEVVQLRKKNMSLRRLVRGALPELPTVPHYARTAVPTFTATIADTAPEHLPRI